MIHYQLCSHFCQLRGHQSTQLEQIDWSGLVNQALEEETILENVHDFLILTCRTLGKNQITHSLK